MTKKCEQCGDKFEPTRGYPKKRFCSNSCRGKWQYKNGNNLPPIQNGLIPWNKGLNKKTDERIKKMSEDRTGEKNWMWNNGRTKRFSDKHKRQLRKWREAVFKRDNYTCQKCEQKGGNLEPHHIKSKSKYPELAFDVDNGQTLCKDCHKLTDNYGGKANKK